MDSDRGSLVLTVIRGNFLVALAFVASGLSGCAVFDPYQVWRYHADYNSERAFSAQMVFYDHLPPKPVRTRLVQWGYNVPPIGPPAYVTLPTEGSTAPGPHLPAAPVPPLPAMIPLAPPTDLLEQSRPPEFTTPAERVPVPTGPTAESSSIQRSSYVPPATHRSASVSSRAWLFRGLSR
jgi:hypothetical protein